MDEDKENRGKGIKKLNAEQVSEQIPESDKVRALMFQYLGHLNETLTLSYRKLGISKYSMVGVPRQFFSRLLVGCTNIMPNRRY